MEHAFALAACAASAATAEENPPGAPGESRALRQPARAPRVADRRRIGQPQHRGQADAAGGKNGQKTPEGSPPPPPQPAPKSRGGETPGTPTRGAPARPPTGGG